MPVTFGKCAGVGCRSFMKKHHRPMVGKFLHGLHRSFSFTSVRSSGRMRAHMTSKMQTYRRIFLSFCCLSRVTFFHTSPVAGEEKFSASLTRTQKPERIRRYPLLPPCSLLPTLPPSFPPCSSFPYFLGASVAVHVTEFCIHRGPLRYFDTTRKSSPAFGFSSLPNMYILRLLGFWQSDMPCFWVCMV